MKHKHHIIPKHMGGDDSPDNIVELTIDEHAEAHRKLYERHGKQEDYLAWQGLSGWLGKEDLIREKLSLNSSRPGKLNTFYGKKHSKETKRIISEKRKGHSDNKGIPKSIEHRQKISNARRNSATQYTFIHADGRTFTGSTRELSELTESHPAEPWKLVKGMYKTHKGWKLG